MPAQISVSRTVGLFVWIGASGAMKLQIPEGSSLRSQISNFRSQIYLRSGRYRRAPFWRMLIRYRSGNVLCELHRARAPGILMGVSSSLSGLNGDR
jgi:hypothetical protein